MPSRPTFRDWIFSAKAFAASLLALYIALALGLPRPYWAMATVYIVANPLTGATRSKALYRVGGTLLGAGASIALVPPLINAPELLTAAVALWTSVLLYIAMMHRTPRSYMFMLGAYTLPLIALPAIGSPQNIFDVALARAEEIILGITCASVVGSLVLPASVTGVFRQKTAQWLGDARQWALDMLSAGSATDAKTDVARHHSRFRLGTDIAAMDQLIGQLAYDADRATRVRDARALRGRMAMLLPVLSSLGALVEALRHQPGGVPAPLAARMAAVGAWIQAKAGQGEAGATKAVTDPPGTAGATTWTRALAAAAGDRLDALADLWHDCTILQQRLGDTRPSGEWSPAFRRWDLGGARHYDHGMLLFATASVALAIFCMGMIWIWTGWADGAGALALGAVSCCFFAALDDPVPMIRSFFWGNVVCLVAAALYVFLILTNVHDFPLLALLFGVLFLPIGVLLAQPRLALMIMPLAVNTATYVGIQETYSADFHSFVNGNLAGVAGILFALVWTLLTRPFGAQVAMRRLERASWQSIAVNALRGDGREHAEARGRLMDRLGQLVPRLAAAPEAEARDGFAEVRVELSALALQRELPQLPADAREAVQAVLEGVADHYRDRLDGAGRSQVDAAALEAALLRALQILAGAADVDGDAAGPAISAGRIALAALVDIRLVLSPAATAYPASPAAAPASAPADGVPAILPTPATQMSSKLSSQLS